MNKTRTFGKRFLTVFLALALLLTSVAIPAEDVSAASKKAVKSVSLKINSKKATKKTISLEKGKKATIKVTVKPASAKKKITFKSSKKSVATVSKKGVVTAKKAGTAKITVTVTGKNKKKKTTWVKIKVTNPKTTTPQTPSTPSTVEVTGVNATITPSTTIDAGSVAQVVASVTPDNATNKSLTYTSSNTNVATVNAAGAVTGLNAGTTVITVSSANGKTAQITVTVVDVKATAVTLDRTSVELTKSGTTTLKATVSPSNAKDQLIKWTSEDPTVATVDQNGLVTGVKEGSTTIKATNEASGQFAKCVVTVKSNSILADGVTAEVTNPYKDNAGTEYANTVLVGDDMNVRVQVVKNGQPLGNANVKLEMEKVYGNAPYCFEIRDDYITTDANGYANFAIGLTDYYASKYNAVSEIYQSYSVTATEISSNQKANITVKFGHIQLNGIEVENNNSLAYEDIDPSDNAAPYDDGIHKSYSLNGHKTEEYVNSQKVSSYEDDHRVYFTCEPELVLPATKDNELIGNWEVNFPYKGESGNSGAYSVYNTVSNETTTTVVENVPAGLQYITLFFDKMNLSKYTAMYVDLYSQETGANLFHKDVTYANNTDGDQSIQVKYQSDVKCTIVVSIVSQGQVDASNEGYVLTKISGPWATTNDELTTSYPIQNSVTWRNVTNEVTYEFTEWTYEEAKNYLPISSEFLNSTYKYSYKVPAYPHTGDAIITVKDANDKVKAYFLYPTVNTVDEDGKYQNVNVLAPGRTSTGIYAIQASEEEVTQRITNNLTVNGNQAVVDSEKSGMTALEATVVVEGLTQSELSEQNSGKMYTSVQWAPVPNKTEAELVPDFYAIEGQKVVVTAQLYDKNNNLKTDSGKSIKFTYNNGREDVDITAQGQKIGVDDDGDGDTVNVASIMTSTNEKGQAVLELLGTGIDYVEGITAVSEDYNVGLSFDVSEAASLEVKKGNVYWVDLGTTFVDSAVEADSPVRTTNFESQQEKITKVSESEVGRVWKIGFLPVARSHKFAFTGLTTVNRAQQANEFISIDNVPMAYDKQGVDSTLTNEEKNVATITSTVIGETKLNGYINVKDWSDTSNVKFNFYNADGEAVSYKNVGQGEPSVTNTGLQLTMNWTKSGMTVNTYTPSGTSIDKDTNTVVYVEVLDSYGNKRVDETVTYTITGVGATTGSGKTSAQAVYAINLPAPGVTGTSIITIKVGEDISKNVTISYIDQSDAPVFGIKADETENYAVKVTGSNQLTVYFTNKVNGDTLRKEQVKFKQNGSTDVTYEVVAVEKSTSDNNAIIVTLNKDIVNTTEEHTVSIEAFEDTRGIVYEFMDEYGQKLTGSASNVFKPVERK